MCALLQLAGPAAASPGPAAFFSASSTIGLVYTVIKLLVVFTVYMVGVALLTLAERKISAFIQDRLGPNRVLKGWAQPLADGIKNFMKEESLPAAVNRPLFLLAPAMAFVPALLTWAVIPALWRAASRCPEGRMDLVLADLPIGYLVHRRPLLPGRVRDRSRRMVVQQQVRPARRAALQRAQMISYEIAMGMSTIPVILLAGNVTLTLGATIVQQQAHGLWNALSLSVACLIFLIAAFAETNRLPFDLPEAESELIAGYHTEYSAMKFSLFFIAEYRAEHMVTAKAR